MILLEFNVIFGEMDTFRPEIMVLQEIVVINLEMVLDKIMAALDKY
jgi:hypothetical protein